MTDYTKWQPIDTAPKDGREVILYYPELGKGSRVRMGYWYSSVTSSYGKETSRTEEWSPMIGFIGGMYGDKPRPKPTHWMMIPAEPEPPNGNV